MTIRPQRNLTRCGTLRYFKNFKKIKNTVEDPGSPTHPPGARAGELGSPLKSQLTASLNKYMGDIQLTASVNNKYMGDISLPIHYKK